MYIVVQHQISNPVKFWEVFQASTDKLPAGLKVHSVLPNPDAQKQSVFGRQTEWVK